LPRFNWVKKAVLGIKTRIFGREEILRS